MGAKCISSDDLDSGRIRCTFGKDYYASQEYAQQEGEGIGYE